MMIEYTATIRLTPFSEFPLDMLRYDCCYPVTSGGTIDPATVSEDTREVQVRRVTDTRFHGRGWEPFTVRRWRSFGVTVVAVTSETHTANGRGRVVEVPFTFTG